MSIVMGGGLSGGNHRRTHYGMVAVSVVGLYVPCRHLSGKRKFPGDSLFFGPPHVYPPLVHNDHKIGREVVPVTSIYHVKSQGHRV